MAVFAVWSCFFAAFLTRCLAVQTSHNVYPVVGVLFVHELNKDYFQEEFLRSQTFYGISYNDGITFSTNLQSFPDRPGWLRYTQRTPFQNGYLYGTPTQADVGRQVIEVNAFNRKTYETVRQKLIFSIQESVGLMLPYQVEFFIKNKDVEEVLLEEVQQDFQVGAESMWNTQRLSVVNITSALDRGGRVPLPIEGRKEGVYIKMGSDVPFSPCLRQFLDPKIQQRCSEQLPLTLHCEDRFSPQYQIIWCNLTLIDNSQPVHPTAGTVPGDGILQDAGEYNPPSESLESRDYYTDYMITTLIPVVLALILLLILIYIMCCRREGLEKREAKTTDIQLFHHHSIQDNTNELRTMANVRDVPRPLSTLPMFNVRTGERMSPLQHQFNYDTSHVPLITAQH
uniref:Sarcoglycan alpha n=2 Tax=Latimeria chalumnae TaxID=7897 RepID=H3AP57_LATCH